MSPASVGNRLLDGQAAIVTGAGGGIGSAIARALAAAGAAVLANDYGVTLEGGDPRHSVADEVVRQIEASGGRALAHYGSVADSAAAEEMVELALRNFGRIDIMITPHGVMRMASILDMTAAQWREVTSVHLDGTFNCVRAVAPAMCAQRGGSILLVTSVGGLQGSPRQPNYAAAKMGIVGLGYSCALGLGEYGVNVNMLAPIAYTRMTQAMETVAGDRRSRTTADTAASLAVALCAPAARSITGQIYTAAGDRIARWNHPVEEQEAVADGDWSAHAALAVVTQQFDNPPLRRFETQGLILPTSNRAPGPLVSSPSAADPSAPDADSRSLPHGAESGCGT